MIIQAYFGLSKRSRRCQRRPPCLRCRTVEGRGAATIVGEATLTETLATTWADQPFFVINDSAYGRIRARLEGGELGDEEEGVQEQDCHGSRLTDL